MMRIILLALAILSSALLGPAPASGQSGDSSTVHPEARTAIGRLWSPYCPGMMLEVCPSPGGEMLRDSVESMARSGLTADSIVEVIIAEYGEEYRAQPRADGIGRLAWYVPPATLLAGLIMVGAFLTRRRGRRPVVVTPPSDEDEERLRVAMSVLEREERPDF